MTSTSLILVDDRNAIKTVDVDALGVEQAFTELMSHILQVHKTYESGSFDVHGDMYSIIETDVMMALRKPITKDSILSFHTPECDNGLFSIVWKESYVQS